MKAARVVVLSVAIGAGGLAAMLAGKSDPPPVEVKPAVVQVETIDVLIAKGDIPMGTALSAGDLQWQSWPATTANGNFIRKNNRPQAIEDLAGQVARVPFVAGEPIREAKLVNAKGSGFMAAILPTGIRAVSTQISPENGAGGFILPNDRVDVILTRRDPNAEKSGGGEARTSETVLTNIRVLAIDQNIEEKGGQKVVVGKTATLELSPSQAETLVLSQQVGSLSLALRSVTDASKTSEPTEESSGKKNTVNVIRFGVSTQK